MPTTVETTRTVDDPVWTPVLARVPAEALDCLQSSYAVLAERVHGPGSSAALGARCGFRVDGGHLGSTADDRAGEAADLLGLHPDAGQAGADGAVVRRLAEPGSPLYVVADAYDLPWCPYAGQAHMSHSFLVTGVRDGTVTVVDAYHNDTPWGAARPGVWELPADAFDAALHGGADVRTVHAGARPELDADRILAQNAARLRAAAPAVDAYLAAMRDAVGTVDGLQRLVLDVWLLGRERQLHALWLASLGVPGADEMSAQVPRWQALAAQSYVAVRRAARGRPAGAALVDTMADLLAADRAAADRLAASAPDAPVDGRAVRDAVLEALRDTLDLDDDTIVAAATLRDLPRFNSFRLVDVIDRVEERLAVRLPDDGLIATDLRDLTSLCDLFATATGAGVATAIGAGVATPAREGELR